MNAVWPRAIGSWHGINRTPRPYCCSGQVLPGNQFGVKNMFVIAGEALIDFIAAPDGRYQPVAGGAPFNFARALALQGVTADRKSVV